MRILNKVVFILVFVIILSLIIFKAFNIPITHDEVTTALNYFHFSNWQIIMYPDNAPNNQILNTLFSKLSSSIFGLSTWSVRIPSILSFILYTFGIYRILKIIFPNKSILWIAALSLFVTNPYLLDFFSLSRGYGMASAFVTISSSYLLTGFIHKEESGIWKSVFFAILASYSNFTVLVFWSAISILAVVFFITQYRKTFSKLIKRILALAIVSILYLLLILNPILKMTSTDQFHYWSTKGFYKNTIMTSVKNWMYGDGILSDINPNFIGLFVIAIFGFGLSYTIYKLLYKNQRKTIFQNSVILSFLILFTTLVVSQIQILILHTPNLERRIALFLFPLFIILTVSLLSKLEYLKYKWITWSFAIIIPAFMFYHLINSFDGKSVREWWYDENTYEVIDYIKKINPDKPVTLKTYWIFYNSFDFYNKTGKMKGIQLLPNSDIDVNCGADYYYIENGQVDQIKSKYKKVKRFAYSRWLMKRE